MKFDETQVSNLSWHHNIKYCKLNSYNGEIERYYPGLDVSIERLRNPKLWHESFLTFAIDRETNGVNLEDTKNFEYKIQKTNQREKDLGECQSVMDFLEERGRIFSPQWEDTTDRLNDLHAAGFENFEASEYLAKRELHTTFQHNYLGMGTCNSRVQYIYKNTFKEDEVQWIKNVIGKFKDVTMAWFIMRGAEAGICTLDGFGGVWGFSTHMIENRKWNDERQRLWREYHHYDSCSCRGGLPDYINNQYLYYEYITSKKEEEGLNWLKNQPFFNSNKPGLTEAPATLKPVCKWRHKTDEENHPDCEMTQEEIRERDQKEREEDEQRVNELDYRLEKKRKKVEKLTKHDPHGELDNAIDSLELMERLVLYTKASNAGMLSADAWALVESEMPQSNNDEYSSSSEDEYEYEDED